MALRGLNCVACWLPVLVVSILLAGQARPGAKRIRFSGYDWVVKDSAGGRVGPGPNYFSEDAVRVDDDGLKLRVMEKDGRFYCAEVVSVASLGYGTYRFQVASNVDRLAPNLVLGLFTWSDDPGEEGTHKELDVELGRWGNPANDIGQFVVQPFTLKSNIFRFPLPADAGESVHSFTWTPHRAHFTSAVGGSVVQDHALTHRVPAPDRENVRINLWITSGRVPAEGAREVTIRGFEFEPESKP